MTPGTDLRGTGLDTFLNLNPAIYLRHTVDTVLVTH